MREKEAAFKFSVEKNGVRYGAVADSQGPIGGGNGYTRVVTAGCEVSEIDELLVALKKATPGQTIMIRGDTVLDFTPRVFIENFSLEIPAGVTLAGDRGVNGAPGPLLISSAHQTKPLIQVTGKNVRITGLRIQGPDPLRRLKFHYRTFIQQPPVYDNAMKAYFSFPDSVGICTEFSGTEIDNCEISAWSRAGVALGGGDDHFIHHCFFHHCQRMGLGYGVQVGWKPECNRASWGRIFYNLFQDNKHHIAGTGAPGSGYEAAYNVVLPYTEAHVHPKTGKRYGQDHLFDMHGGRDRGDGTNIAGRQVLVHHNTFYSPYVAVRIRGVPQDVSQVHHNLLVEEGDLESRMYHEGNVEFFDNLYGVMPAAGRGGEWLNPGNME